MVILHDLVQSVMRNLALMAFITFLLSGTNMPAQDQVKLDSLQLQLQNAQTDTSKIQTLLAISKYYFMQDFKYSTEYAQQALHLSTEKGYKSLEAKSAGALGLALFYSGDYKSATSNYLHALKFYDETKDTTGIITITHNLGVVYDRLKDFDRALTYYFKVQDLYNRRKIKTDPSPLPTLYNNIANIYQTKADFKSALQYYEKSLRLAEEKGNKSIQGIALNNIGKLYFNDLEQPEKALEYLLEGLKIREETGEKGEIAKSLIFLAGCSYHLKKYAEGKRYADRALALGKEAGSLEIQQHATYALSQNEEGLGHYQESLHAFKDYKSISDSIQNESTSSEITRLQLQYDFEKEEQLRKQEQEKTRGQYIVAIVILTACLLVAVLIVFLIRSKARQTELKRKNLAQDVEIKNKELTTNVMYLIRKNELINNVAERLLNVQDHVNPENHKVIHDIILDLQKEADNDSWKEFELRFNQVHSDFYNNLRKLYPGLSPAEEKLCAFLRLNMSSKEIAAITQQSIKSVEVARARLRKKLNLTNTTSNLVTHLSNL